MPCKVLDLEKVIHRRIGCFPRLLHCFAFVISAPVRTMAWRCHGSDNTDMVNALKEAGIVQSRRVEESMKAVDRALFCLPTTGRDAYMDSPQGIGHGVTISAPHMHAWCLELLSHKLVPGARALDVGSGSGYLTAVMAHMVCEGTEQPSGKVVGIEHIPELVTSSQQATAKLGPWAQQLMDTGRIKLQVGDGRLGSPEDAPYDAIHVGAAAPQIPTDLVNQLAPGGRLIVPVGPDGGHQSLMAIDKSEDGQRWTHTEVMGVRYVPLTSKEYQLGRWW